MIKFKEVGDGYEATETYTYHSPRYNKSITVYPKFYSDGATGVFDINSDSYWIHDVICRYGVWDDGDPISNWQASMVFYDILHSEGYHVLDILGFIGTFLFGGGAARKRMI